MLPLVQSLNRSTAERDGLGPWARPQAQVTTADDRLTRITERVLDPRVTLRQDPADPEIGTVPFQASGAWATGLPVGAVTWIDRGVLKELSYGISYGRPVLNRSEPLYNSEAYRMSGGPSSISEMIAATQRGLLVTRFRGVRALDPRGPTLLQAGTTADGLWLVERGKVVTAVKNFRFRDSPLYAFNNLLALGTPVPTLMEQPTVVPPAHIREFNMMSLVDAV
jgi:predicted Zn-dependent protease